MYWKEAKSLIPKFVYPYFEAYVENMYCLIPNNTAMSILDACK